MNCIVAIDQKNGIGKDGKLLFQLSKDKTYFKNITLGNTVVMGRKTLESLPGGKPLTDRHNIVLTRNEGFVADGVEVCHTLKEVLKLTRIYGSDSVYVIGGAEIYKLMLPYCKYLYVTRVHDLCEDADTFFPEIKDDEWEEICASDIIDDNGHDIQFVKYKRKKVE